MPAQNLLVHDRAVLLADWGRARVVDCSPSAAGGGRAAAWGSLPPNRAKSPYYAPELAAGGVIDPVAVDVFACGMTLLRLLSPAALDAAGERARISFERGPGGGDVRAGRGMHAAELRNDGGRRAASQLCVVLPTARLAHVPGDVLALLRAMLAHAPVDRPRPAVILRCPWVAEAPPLLPLDSAAAAAAAAAAAPAGAAHVEPTGCGGEGSSGGGGGGGAACHEWVCDCGVPRRSACGDCGGIPPP